VTLIAGVIFVALRAPGRAEYKADVGQAVRDLAPAETA
jgi:hypothetical protein